MSVTPNIGSEIPGPLATGEMPALGGAACTPEDRPGRGRARYMKRNPSLLIGTLMLMSLLLFCVIGSFTVNTQRARALSTMATQPPSWELPFGSDRQGRDLLAVMVAGTPLTLRIGLIAGLIGVTFGTILGFVAAYYGGLRTRSCAAWWMSA